MPIDLIKTKTNSNKSKSKTTSKKSSSSHRKSSSSSSHRKSSSSSSHKKSSSSHKKSLGLTPESISIKVHSKSPETLQEFQLKFPEPLPDKINFDEKIAKKMNTLFNKHHHAKPFRGHALFKDIFYLYLFNKYKTKCLITEEYEDLVPEIKIIINPDNPNIILNDDDI